MLDQLIHLYTDVWKSKYEDGHIGRFYLDHPATIWLYPGQCFPLLTGFSSLKDAFNDVMLDIRADGIITDVALKLRESDIEQQNALTYERVLYPSDRCALWAKTQGMNMQEAVMALGSDIEAGTRKLDAANIPTAVTGKFNEDGHFYPFVGLSWSQTLGYQLNLTAYRLKQTGSVFVSSRLKQTMGLTNGNPQLPRQDGLPSVTHFDIPSVGFLLSLRNGVLDVHATFEDLEVYWALSMEIMRYAYLQKLLAHHNGWEVGRLSVTVTHPWRYARAEMFFHEARGALEHTVLKGQVKLDITTTKDGLGDYLFDDVLFSSGNEEGNVVPIKPGAGE